MTASNKVIKKDFMAKRAQMKSKFKKSLEDFKSRWFVLTPTLLSYYDGSLESGQGKLKGQIMVENIVIVEVVSPDAFKGRANAFQVVYKVVKDGVEDNYTLYIIAVHEQQMYDWINAIRQACSDNNCEFSLNYHPSIWLHNQKPQKFGCCNTLNQRVLGCTPSTPLGVTISPYNHTPPPNVTKPRWGQKVPSKTGGRPPAVPPSPDVGHSAGNRIENPLKASMQVNGSRPQPPVPAKPARSGETKFGKVVAVYAYEASLPDELDLVQDEEYDLLAEYKEQAWLQVRNKHKETGHVPSTFVRFVENTSRSSTQSQPDLTQFDVLPPTSMPLDKSLLLKSKNTLKTKQMQKFFNKLSKCISQLARKGWYYPDTTRAQGETILLEDGREGCFIIREANTCNNVYSLSLLCRKSPQSDLTVKHYHVKTTPDGKFYFSDRHAFFIIPELIDYHMMESGGLIGRLKCCPYSQPKLNLGTEFEDIDPKKLKYLEQLGQGQFGIVRKAMYEGKVVAVKEMKENSMSEVDFLNEAKIMMQLRHPNLVTLFGVCTSSPLKLVTEFVKHGALLTYLKKNKVVLQEKTTRLLDICLQVCIAMEYLEHRRLIHRDLAARNCLVGEKDVVKVADFGLARCVTDDDYTSSAGSKFPVKWSAPEVLAYCTFSSKSDVWAFGVLMWEVFAFGDVPYGRTRTNGQVVDAICNRNKRLSQPYQCPDNVFQIMHMCWKAMPEERPTFIELKEELQVLSDNSS